MHRPPHILNASTNLLAICFVIIGGLKISNLNSRTFADETAWISAVLLFCATLSSYLAIRNEGTREYQATFADWTFISGLVFLAAALVIAAVQL
ncbi:MAG TPA: hypothetical protein VGG10_17145 [Rhizomicrobium sp.]